MKNSRNYVEHEVVRVLNRKHDVFVNDRQMTVFILTEGKGDLGIKSKGKISFLKNYCGYHILKVTPKSFAQAKKDYHS